MNISYSNIFLFGSIFQSFPYSILFVRYLFRILLVLLAAVSGKISVNLNGFSSPIRSRAELSGTFRYPETVQSRNSSGIWSFKSFTHKCVPFSVLMYFKYSSPKWKRYFKSHLASKFLYNN